MKSEVGISKNIRCAHCGNVTPHHVIANHDVYEELKDNKGKFVGVWCGRYYMAVCATCKDLSLFLSWDMESPKNVPSFDYAILTYPKPKTFPSQIVPENIITTYNEAIKIKNISPPLFVVQIGKALEYLCHNQKAKGRTLVQQIQDLSKNGIIPPTFSKMTDIMRIFRNYGAHASDIDIDKNEAALIDDFFSAIVEYVYIAPYKVNKLWQRIQQRRQTKKQAQAPKKQTTKK